MVNLPVFRLLLPPRDNHTVVFRRFDTQTCQNIIEPCRQLGVTHLTHRVRTYTRLCHQDYRLTVAFVCRQVAAFYCSAAVGASWLAVAADGFRRKSSCAAITI